MASFVGRCVLVQCPESDILIPVIALWNGKIVWSFAELQPVDYKENLCVLLDKILFVCRDPGSNQGPLDLQSNALPTELSRLRRDVLRIIRNVVKLPHINVCYSIFCRVAFTELHLESIFL